MNHFTPVAEKPVQTAEVAVAGHTLRVPRMVEEQMPQLTAEVCRSKECELRRMAKVALNPIHRAMLLLMADTWDRMANSFAE